MAVNTSLLALPEGCIAYALSMTSPGDACRLALVASTFHSASQSDVVWERFLPENYREMFCQSQEGAELLRSFASKKQIYLYLCDHPILLDGATKVCPSFRLRSFFSKISVANLIYAFVENG